MYRQVFALVLCAVAGLSHAKEAPVKLDVEVPISEQIQRVEAALRSEDYSEISLEDRSRVQQSLSRIKIKLGDNGSVSGLGGADRTQIFNDQEVVNTIMTRGKEDSRMICRRERSTGSNMPQSVCMTVAQRRQARERGVDYLNNQHTPNTFDSK